MSTLPTRIEREAGRRLSAIEIVNITAAREKALSRMLMLYITTGVVFMLLPGTFLGVWNLVTISSHRAANSVSPAWIQAHGHSQIFGWIGTFILGIGFYSIPKLRHLGSFALAPVWCAWGLWTSGVALRWLGNVYPWHWRVLVPLSSVCELASCCLCMEVCPQFTIATGFAGAAIINQVRLLNLHPTGAVLKRERLEAMAGDGGIHECSYAQNCVRICPKHIPLTNSISNVYGQVMKQAIVDLFQK